MLHDIPNLNNRKFTAPKGGTETDACWSLCAIWCCHGANDGEELHAANVRFKKVIIHVNLN